MEITGLGWCGTRTENPEALARFYQQVLGLPLGHVEPSLWVFDLPDGRHVEVFGSGYPGRDHFSTGPVIGFAVTDLAAATEELRRAGIELLGNPGPGWQHFRGPDGNVYELVASGQQVTVSSAPPVRLPGGEQVTLATQRWALPRWAGEPDPPELPRIWAVKPAFAVNGRRSCAELAVVERLRPDGWDGVWVSGFAGNWVRREWFPAPGFRSLREAGAPDWADQAFEQLRLANGGKLGGFFDVFAWRPPGDVRFVEVKVGPDRIRANQRTFLQTALRYHRPEQFMIVEVAG
jgi:hypothetical protein